MTAIKRGGGLTGVVGRNVAKTAIAAAVAVAAATVVVATVAGAVAARTVGVRTARKRAGSSEGVTGIDVMHFINDTVIRYAVPSCQLSFHHGALRAFCCAVVGTLTGQLFGCEMNSSACRSLTL